MTHSPEPWDAKNGVLIDAIGKRIPALYEDGLDDDDAVRVAVCINVCRGIPIEVLEKHQGTEHAAKDPETWLSHPVTEDGEGYLLASPAGGVMRLSSEQRERMAAALVACRGIPTEELTLVRPALIYRDAAAIEKLRLFVLDAEHARLMKAESAG